MFCVVTNEEATIACGRRWGGYGCEWSGKERVAWHEQCNNLYWNFNRYITLILSSEGNCGFVCELFFMKIITCCADGLSCNVHNKFFIYNFFFLFYSLVFSVWGKVECVLIVGLWVSFQTFWRNRLRKRKPSSSSIKLGLLWTFLE